MKFRPLPPAVLLRESLAYEPGTGTLKWRIRPRAHFVDDRSWKLWNTKHAGNNAGVVSNGRRCLTIGNRPFEASRIIWKLVTGDDPEVLIDHRDVNPLNDRWDNLREASHSQNRANFPGRSRVSRYKGVSRHTHGRWQAQIDFKLVHYHLGLFDDEEAAHAAYVAKAKELHGEFANDGRGIGK